MTPEQLIEIEARANAASPGPWKQWKDDPRVPVICDPKYSAPMSMLGIAGDLAIVWTETDTAFLTHARTDIPALIAALRQERDENARLREALEQFAKCDLNERNCVSWDVANRRIRNIANRALKPQTQ